MEKIKAGEVLKHSPVRYFTIDSDGTKKIHVDYPHVNPNGSFDSTVLIESGRIGAEGQEFSEDTEQDKLSPINTTRHYLLREIEELSMSEFTRTQQNSLDRLLGIIRKRHGLGWFIPESMLGYAETEIQEDKLEIEKIALSEVLKRNIMANERARARNSKYVGFYENGSLFLSNEIPSELEVGKSFKIYEIDHSENAEPNLPPHPLMATDEELGKHMSKFIGTQNKSIFQEGDIVHVLSYSNQGELGVSTQGVIKAIKSNSFIAVEIVNGIEEVHEEKNISFAPFSIHEAGFSQVRPEREIKVGDWGFFYNKKPAKSFCYQQIYSMGDLKKVVIGVDYPFTTQGGSFYKYFSHTPPQLAEGIPNPFDKC